VLVDNVEDMIRDVRGEEDEMMKAELCKYKQLVEDLKKPLYPRCEKYSRIIRQQQKKATETKGKAAPKELAKSAWTSAHPKLVMGKPMMAAEELASAGVNTRGLHNHHITHAIHKENPSIMG